MELLDARSSDPNSEQYKNLSDDVIIAQGIEFFVAGFDTTGGTLATFSYNMAKYEHMTSVLGVLTKSQSDKITLYN